MNPRSTSVVVALGAAAGLLTTGCRGKILGTAALSGPGVTDVQFQSSGAPVVLWADTVGKWTGSSRAHFAAHYEIDVLGGTTKLGHVACDTSGSSQEVCGTTISSGNANSGDCEIKLTCAVPAVPAGPATLHVVATVGAGTTDVTRMNLNVRDN